MLFACRELSLYCLEPGVTGLPEVHNPYQLPMRDSVDVILVTTNWYRWMRATRADDIDGVFARLRRASRAVVGVEGWDTFDLGLPPSGLEHVDLLIKAQGLYLDRDRYNARSGPLYPRGPLVWSPDEGSRYDRRHLDKLRLSVPCFLGIDRRVRDRVRRAKPDIGLRAAWLRRAGDIALESSLAAELRLRRPRALAHCVVSLTHVSRLELLRALRAAEVSGEHRVIAVPENVYGTPSLDSKVPIEVRAAWQDELSREGLLGEPESRPVYRRAMLAHRSVLAPTGYGELTFRHAEAWLSGRVLVCPDVSYAQTMFPFVDRRNVVFSSDDWSDLPGILEGLARDAESARRIGRTGREDWLRWSAEADRLLDAGIAAHVREALGTALP
jgi:hypothetical protein